MKSDLNLSSLNLVSFCVKFFWPSDAKNFNSVSKQNRSVRANLMHEFSSRLLSDRETIMYSYGRLIPNHLYTFIQWHCFHITVYIVGYSKVTMGFSTSN